MFSYIDTYFYYTLIIYICIHMYLVVPLHTSPSPFQKKIRKKFGHNYMSIWFFFALTESGGNSVNHSFWSSNSLVTAGDGGNQSRSERSRAWHSGNCSQPGQVWLSSWWPILNINQAIICTDLCLTSVTIKAKAYKSLCSLTEVAKKGSFIHITGTQQLLVLAMPLWPWLFRSGLTPP